MSSATQIQQEVAQLRQSISALVMQEHFHEAAGLCAKLLKRSPHQSPAFLLSYAKILGKTARFSEAIRLCKRALAIAPDNSDGWYFMARCYQRLGQFERAVPLYEKAIAIDPDNSAARYNLGLMRLMLTDMREGYDGYALRFQAREIDERSYPIPRWDGSPLTGKRLLLWSEQGIGEVLMFAGLLPVLLSQCKSITMETYPKLIPLLARSFPDIHYEPFKATVQPGYAIEHFDVHCPIGDLAEHCLRTRIPAGHPAYLKPDPNTVAAIKARYAAMGPEQTIGISWHTTDKETGILRRIQLEAWLPILTLPGFRFISLQYGDHRDEIEAFCARYNVEIVIDDAVNAFEDTDTFAAQIAALDQVITIQNSTAHLAGALGVPTSLLLSIASDWRWGAEREDNLWYRSVRILRQSESMDWKKVMKRVRTQLSG